MMDDSAVESYLESMRYISDKKTDSLCRKLLLWRRWTEKIERAEYALKCELLDRALPVVKLYLSYLDSSGDEDLLFLQQLAISEGLDPEENLMLSGDEEHNEIFIKIGFSKDVGGDYPRWKWALVTSIPLSYLASDEWVGPLRAAFEERSRLKEEAEKIKEAECARRKDAEDFAKYEELKKKFER